MTADLPILEPLARYWREGPRHHLDVHAMLDGGVEPYETIMACLAALPPDELLMLHVPFEPRPLLRQLRLMGFAYDVRHQEAADWTVDIRLDEGPSQADVNTPR